MPHLTKLEACSACSSWAMHTSHCHHESTTMAVDQCRQVPVVHATTAECCQNWHVPRHRWLPQSIVMRTLATASNILLGALRQSQPNIPRSAGEGAQQGWYLRAGCSPGRLPGGLPKLYGPGLRFLRVRLSFYTPAVRLSKRQHQPPATTSKWKSMASLYRSSKAPTSWLPVTRQAWTFPGASRPGKAGRSRVHRATCSTGPG